MGVIFDQQLNFKSHLQQSIKKGTKAALALAGVARTTWGVPYRYARQLFQTVIAPRTDYAAIIWHRPKQNGSTADTTQIRKLNTVQRLAMKAISGCYRTTPTAAMEIETELQPVWIRLQTRVLLAITRMQSLSEAHPIKGRLINALRTRTANISHRSNLENILQQFPFMTGSLETIDPFIRPPWWETAVKIQIAASKDEAVNLHDTLQRQDPRSNGIMTIYTDGSGINGKIGAAAYNATTDETRHQHLGDELRFNVYAGELTALHMGVIQWQESDYLKCRIFTDSQAAGTSVCQPWRQSGQKLIIPIVDVIDTLTVQNPQRQLEIIWIPGHRGIVGNERADVGAKQAAHDPIIGKPFTHGSLKSCRAQYIRALAKTSWKKEWTENNKTAKQLRRILVTDEDKRGTKLYYNMANRRISAKLAQLRTGHCPPKWLSSSIWQEEQSNM